jgi:hypothetical protein
MKQDVTDLELHIRGRLGWSGISFHLKLGSCCVLFQSNLFQYSLETRLVADAVVNRVNL